MDNLALPSQTGCMSNAALAAGTTTTISTTGTTNYAIKSKVFAKAAITNGATPTTDSTTGAAFVPFAANNGTVVVVGFDSSGNTKACQGSVQALDAGGLFINAPQFPIIPETICPIGYIVLKGGSTLVGNFTFGSSNLSAVTGMTYTFVSVALGMPDRPQVA